MPSDHGARNVGRYLRIVAPTARPRWGRRWLGLAVIAALVATAMAATAAAAGPAPEVDWRSCPQEFQCATMSAPRDYDHPRRSQIRLAVIRHEATDSASRIGTLFYNPGGPGESGVSALPQAYAYFPPAVRAKFDIVSWDPRGVGSSTAVQCFATLKAEDRFLGGVGRPGETFPVGNSEKQRWIKRYRGFGQRCGRTNGALLRHVSTADTARDLNLLRRAVGDRRLSYWGTSYGSFLGATYANLFPRRVRALVLDGNVNPGSYVHRRLAANDGSFLSTFLRQHSDQGAARTLDAFLNLCGRAGPARCAFAAPSAVATREKYDALLQQLRTDPASANTSYADLTSMVLAFLASPANWPQAAQCLQDVSANGRICEGVSPPSTRTEQLLAILCSESPNPTSSGFRALDAFANQRSGAVGPAKSWASQPCAGWPAAAADRYGGPWDRRTANPLLVIGNTHDPNTPHRSSRAMAGQLARARLLTVDGYGHMELTNPSTCANEHAKRYLIAKTLPPPGTECEQDLVPFEPAGGKP